MTREQAIARIKDHKIVHKMSEPRAIYISEALDMAIKALEQEPCEDAISRQAVLKIIDGWYDNNRDTENIEDLIVLITYMDSVKSQEPTGQWIRITNGGAMKQMYICSECRRQIEDDGIEALITIKYPYCHCGAKMEVEQHG